MVYSNSKVSFIIVLSDTLNSPSFLYFCLVLKQDKLLPNPLCNLYVSVKNSIKTRKPYIKPHCGHDDTALS